MNERIRELAEQSGVEFDESFSSEPETIYYLGLSHFEKFAELIVRECCDWIDGSPSTDADQLVLTKSFIIANLKGHFGVE